VNSAPGTQDALYDKSMSYTSTFENYLMYQPPAGVWIAVKEYSWNFQVSATNQRLSHKGRGA